MTETLAEVLAKPIGGLTIIKLSKGYEAIVDESDYERLNKFRWHADVRELDSGTLYVRARRSTSITEKGRSVSMQREIMGKPPNGLVIDHKNGNPLDNRKENLRFVTQSVNMYNSRNALQSSGVNFCRSTGKWIARFKGKWLKRHLTRELALEAVCIERNKQ